MIIQAQLIQLNIIFLKYKNTDPPKKEIILKKNNKNYKDIIELEIDKYLLLIDDKK